MQRADLNPNLLLQLLVSLLTGQQLVCMQQRFFYISLVVQVWQECGNHWSSTTESQGAQNDASAHK